MLPKIGSMEIKLSISTFIRLSKQLQSTICQPAQLGSLMLFPNTEDALFALKPNFSILRKEFAKSAEISKDSMCT